MSLNRALTVTGLLAVAAAGVALPALHAPPATAEGGVTTVTVPAEIAIETKYMQTPGTTNDNCTVMVLMRWKAVPNAIPGQIRRANFRIGNTHPATKIAVEPFPQDRIVVDEQRVFTAPPGYHQVRLGQSAASAPGPPVANCDVLEDFHRNRGYVSLGVEVKVTATGTTPVGTPPVATTPVAFCQGRRATIVGTKGRDVLNGTAKRDVIVGLGGNDVIRGRGGNDLICAGNGNDVVLAGAGNDIVRGGGGNDRISGQAGADRLFGEKGRDQLRGGGGLDRLYGGNQPDRLFGNAGNDWLIGGRARDRGVGGPGRDRFRSVEIRVQ